MARIELAPEVLHDFDRFIDHLAQFDADVAGRIEEIVEAIQVLRHSPLIGRKVKDGTRELVIGSASRGYVALYRFVADIDVVFVLAVRAQRESGYKPLRRQADADTVQRNLPPASRQASDRTWPAA